MLVTTSKLLTTGVDAQTCAVIVLDQTIRSMTELEHAKAVMPWCLRR